MQLQEFSRWTPAIWGQCALDEWRDRLQSVCGRYHPSLREEGALVTGGVTLTDAAGMEIVQVATDVDVVRRTQDDVKKEFGEHFFLLVQLEGVCGIEQQGRQSIIAPGDCILVEFLAAVEFLFQRPLQQPPLRSPAATASARTKAQRTRYLAPPRRAGSYVDHVARGRRQDIADFVDEPPCRETCVSCCSRRRDRPLQATAPRTQRRRIGRAGGWNSRRCWSTGTSPKSA